MAIEGSAYPARLAIDYPERLNRVTTAFRIILVIPIFVVLSTLTGASGSFVTGDGNTVVTVAGGLAGSVGIATMLMILFRRRYPRWWFDFALALTRFSTRAAAYGALLSDQYPSTEDEQSVHLDIDYPDVERDLNRWLPLVKWLLAIPHFIVLIFLSILVLFSVVIAWFAILFTGRYPRGLFNFVVGVGRWQNRVLAYAVLMVTDEYPPFSLDE